MRKLWILGAALAALALPVPAASQAGRAASPVTASANGSADWTIELPNPFGVEVWNRTLSFNARKHDDGSASGRFECQQVVEGTAFVFCRRG